MYILQYNQNESKPGEAKASDPELRNIFTSLTCVTRAASCSDTAAIARHFPHPGSQFLSLCDLHNNTENTGSQPQHIASNKNNKKAQEWTSDSACDETNGKDI